MKTAESVKNKYLNHFFSLKCARDLIIFFTGSKVSAAKEITESFAMFYAAKEFVGEDVMTSGVLDDYHIVVVGDGGLPRTASTFSFLTKATVDTIDPQFSLVKYNKITKELGFKVRGLNLLKNKIENVKINCQNKKTLLLMPHSHADVYDSIKACKNYQSLGLISMPCCVKLPEQIKKTSKKYEDQEVWSPKRTIYSKQYEPRTNRSNQTYSNR